MSGGEDWIMRPVLRGCCQYESLVNGVLDLGDVDRMNEALDIQDYNEQLLIDRAKNK